MGQEERERERERGGDGDIRDSGDECTYQGNCRIGAMWENALLEMVVWSRAIINVITTHASSEWRHVVCVALDREKYS